MPVPELVRGLAAVAFNFTMINSGVMRVRLRRAAFPHFVLKGEPTRT